MRQINRLRAGRDLPALRVHANLTRKARRWATTMAGARKIWHSRLPNGVTARWQKLGENVGMGPSVPHLHAAFVASDSHHANLVDPAFRYAGVGVVVSGGIMFVSQVFLQPAPTLHRRARVTGPSSTAQRVMPVRPTQPPVALLTSIRRPSLLFRPIS